MADIKKLAEELTKLTILEANELKEHLKDEYGIEPAAVAVAAGPAAGADAADEKTEFTVTLKEVGSGKVAVIKAVKEITGTFFPAPSPCVIPKTDITMRESFISTDFDALRTSNKYCLTAAISTCDIMRCPLAA